VPSPVHISGWRSLQSLISFPGNALYGGGTGICFGLMISSVWLSAEIFALMEPDCLQTTQAGAGL
jgi:hypothetical protein